MTKTKLQILGWNETKLRERMQGCRDGIKEIKSKNRPDTEWTYRFLFISLYLKYKNWLAVLKNS
jgi:hypothetical protein